MSLFQRKNTLNISLMACLKNMIPLSPLFSRAMNLIPSKRSRLYFLIKKKGWKGIDKSTHHRSCIPPPFHGILQIVAGPMIVVVSVQDQIQIAVDVLPLVDNRLDRTRFPLSINSCPTIGLNAKYVSRVDILLWIVGIYSIKKYNHPYKPTTPRFYLPILISLINFPPFHPCLIHYGTQTVVLLTMLRMILQIIPLNQTIMVLNKSN